MGFGVFIHRSDSIYDDSPAERYQFPKQYLGRVEECVGDWILYYEPRKVPNTRGYFATAKVQEIVPDPAPGMHIALIEPGSYLDFPDPVPFMGIDGIAERGVLNEAGQISGRAQSAVRPISPRDFNRIIELGLARGDPLLPRVDVSSLGFSQEQEPFIFEQTRDRAIISRAVRDRSFRRLVLRAYEQRCAITGLKLINGGGRAEAAAAHIRPVEAKGPDSISNGIALSGTAHWMFDRGLISLADDLTIIVSRQINDPAGVRGIINSTGRALAPQRLAERPHPSFLEWHRQHCFKQ
ncbi:MAG: restriction endonuclease [Rhizobiaceae bacterium]|jgi:putative restriction endonuclease|nr:restriction endonuclease [Rhizobiaceae bacterium]